ncbi:uncharacterized protein TM35_000332050 [Trypanosoma theileri]|uniref:Uncharacterized protein n=1 Tax=Trypanosoma theileri TaxID=67003 RepID=A0A1X0NMN4_9TRYP|nr:uncharacterized protein TM35_000332050 [Trypanosoma theileri]ORC85748.1 hypothetical protein TM35_000332050 [Trypanosoma theileri]
MADSTKSSPSKVTGEVKTAFPIVGIAEGLPYTESEKAMLQSQLDQQCGGDISDVSLWEKSILPLLVSMVTKVLELAASKYGENAENTTNNNNNNDNSNNRNSNNNVTTPANNRGLKVSAPGTAKTPSKMDLFLEENAYIVEQLQLQQWPFFTLPRLVELLANPFTYNCDSEGHLRGEKLQAAIGRCVLVSAPLFTSEGNDYSGWR